VRFTPENVDTKLSDEIINQIEGADWGKESPNIITSSKVLFADAGENFESVSCPFCGGNLMEWWSSAMKTAYSEEKGFANLEVVTPCCGKTTSLHSLAYKLPQGFYRVMVEFEPALDPSFSPELTNAALGRMTGVSWRTLYACY
jgi:hypothetical protein